MRRDTSTPFIAPRRQFRLPGVFLCVLFALYSLDGRAALIFQETIQGGMSLDASGVSTPLEDSDLRFPGDPLDVLIPSGAEIRQIFAIVRSPTGFGLADPGVDPGVVRDPASWVAINEVDLTEAILTLSSDTLRVYELDPSVFGITGTGSYSYTERTLADTVTQDFVGSGFGTIGGTALAVIYDHPTLTGRRHVVLSVPEISNGSETITGLPTTGIGGPVLLSAGIDYECSDEQGSSIYLDGTLITTTAGGRDDGEPWDDPCGLQEWNSLITQGSFGINDFDEIVGLDGDSPVLEPGGGPQDSRLSDELYQSVYGGTGSLTLSYISDGDSWLTTYGMVIPLVSPGSESVPEPATLGLLAAGLIGFMWRRTRLA